MAAHDRDASPQKPPSNHFDSHLYTQETGKEVQIGMRAEQVFHPIYVTSFLLIVDSFCRPYLKTLATIPRLRIGGRARDFQLARTNLLSGASRNPDPAGLRCPLP
jgi:hypothetical protein